MTKSDTSISLVTEPETTQTPITSDIAALSPVDIGEKMFKLAAAALTLQGRALVLLRQPNLRLSSGREDSQLRRIRRQQEDVRATATFVLDRVVVGAIRGVTDLQSTAQLFQVLANTGADPKALDERLEAVTRMVEETRFQNSIDHARELAELDAKLSEQQSSFAKHLGELRDALDGDTGAIAKAGKAVEAVQTEIEADIQKVIEESNVIGEHLGKLVTGILTLITGHKDDAGTPKKEKAKDKGKDEGKEDDEDEDEDEDDEEEPEATTESTTVEPFPVEAIAPISDGVEATVAALTAFRINNERLAKLYQQLAEFDALLAATQVVADQSAAFVRAVASLARAAEQLQIAWAEIVKGTKHARAQLRSEDLEIDAFTATLRESGRLWKRVEGRANEITRAFVGLDNIFPPTTRFS
jgi:hypothetical protein